MTGNGLADYGLTAIHYLVTMLQKRDDQLQSYARQDHTLTHLPETQTISSSQQPTILLLHLFTTTIAIAIAIAVLLPNILKNSVLPINRRIHNLPQNPPDPQSLPPVRAIPIPNTQDIFSVLDTESHARDFILANLTECIADESEEELFP